MQKNCATTGGIEILRPRLASSAKYLSLMARLAGQARWLGWLGAATGSQKNCDPFGAPRKQMALLRKTRPCGLTFCLAHRMGAQQIKPEILEEARPMVVAKLIIIKPMQFRLWGCRHSLHKSSNHANKQCDTTRRRHERKRICKHNGKRNDKRNLQVMANAIYGRRNLWQTQFMANAMATRAHQNKNEPGHQNEP